MLAYLGFALRLRCKVTLITSYHQKCFLIDVNNMLIDVKYALWVSVTDFNIYNIVWFNFCAQKYGVLGVFVVPLMFISYTTKKRPKTPKIKN